MRAPIFSISKLTVPKDFLSAEFELHYKNILPIYTRPMFSFFFFIYGNLLESKSCSYDKLSKGSLVGNPAEHVLLILYNMLLPTASETP